MLLAVLSSNAVAAWVKAGSNQASTFYAAPDTVRKVGTSAKMWSLMDNSAAKMTPTGKQYFSIKAQQEYECNESQSRLLYISYHSGSMGDGEVIVSSNGPFPWEPVPPGSGVEALWKIACGTQMQPPAPPPVKVEQKSYQSELADCQNYADASPEPYNAAAAEMGRPTVAGVSNGMRVQAEVRDRLIRRCLAVKGYRVP